MRQGLMDNGFTPELWVPEFGWNKTNEDDISDESLASVNPYEAQMEAALSSFKEFFINMKSWCHLGAEMQAGKTGVVNALIRLVLKNYPKLGIRDTHIFIFTGMNDNSWRKQTKERLPKCVRSNVMHNSDLDSLRRALLRISEQDNNKYLRNVMVIVDESHIASSFNNRPASNVYAVMRESTPYEKWDECNLRLMTISATDPAAILNVDDLEKASIIQLRTTEEYQSVEGLKDQDRLYDTLPLHQQEGMLRFKQIVDASKFTSKKYFIIRPSQRRYADVEGNIRTVFGDVDIIHWNSTNSKGTKMHENTSSGSSIEDINTILKEMPDKNTFILLKNMFYASKTLNDAHVGVLHDRSSIKDDTNLQSLLGRSCGYNKNKDTIIFTSLETVENYIQCWKQLNMPKQDREDIDTKNLAKRMPHILSKNNKFVTDEKEALNAKSMRSGVMMDTNTTKKQQDEKHFKATWSPMLDTIEDAHKWCEENHMKLRVALKTDENGFYTCTTTKCKVHTLREVMKMKDGKTTANMPIPKKIGNHSKRLYIGYTDLNDKSTAKFIVRVLSRTHMSD
jgi:hypothetical protein